MKFQERNADFFLVFGYCTSRPQRQKITSDPRGGHYPPIDCLLGSLPPDWLPTGVITHRVVSRWDHYPPIGYPIGVITSPPICYLLGSLPTDWLSYWGHYPPICYLLGSLPTDWFSHWGHYPPLGVYYSFTWLTVFRPFTIPLLNLT